MHAGTCACGRERGRGEGTGGSQGLKKQQPENPSLHSNKSDQLQLASLSHPMLKKVYIQTLGDASTLSCSIL